MKSLSNNSIEPVKFNRNLKLHQYTKRHINRRRVRVKMQSTTSTNVC